MNSAPSDLRLACSNSLVIAAFDGGNALLVVLIQDCKPEFDSVESLSDVEENSLDLDSFSDGFEEFCCVTVVTSWHSHQLGLESQRDQALDLPDPPLSLAYAGVELGDVPTQLPSDLLLSRRENDLGVVAHAMTPACCAAPSAKPRFMYSSSASCGVAMISSGPAVR